MAYDSSTRTVVCNQAGRGGRAIEGKEGRVRESWSRRREEGEGWKKTERGRESERGRKTDK